MQTAKKSIARKPEPKIRKDAPAIRRVVADARKKPKLYIERVVVHGEGE